MGPGPISRKSPQLADSAFASVDAGAEEPRRNQPSTLRAGMSMEKMPFPQIFSGFSTFFSGF
jgi:hypothetical protein